LNKQSDYQFVSFVLLGCCAAWVGSWLPTFRENISVQYSSNPRSLLGRLMRDRYVVPELPTYAAQHLRRAKMSNTPRRKHEISAVRFSTVTLFRRFVMYKAVHTHFFVVKGPAADVTDSPQPWGILCNPVMKMISCFNFSLSWKTGGMKLTGKNRSIRGENLSQCHFVHHKSYIDWPGIEPPSLLWAASRAAREKNNTKWYT
jgi:hypothetical protein